MATRGDSNQARRSRVSRVSMAPQLGSIQDGPSGLSTKTGVSRNITTISEGSPDGKGTKSASSRKVSVFENPGDLPGLSPVPPLSRHTSNSGDGNQNLFNRKMSILTDQGKFNIISESMSLLNKTRRESTMEQL